MKGFIKVLVAVMAIVLVLGIVGCKPKPATEDPKTAGLTPADITPLADLINYATRDTYYNPAPVAYANTSAEETKLTARIDEKKNDPGYDDLSSIVKIFANSNAAGIISAMSSAALPVGKMTAVVDYLAGESSVEVNESIIASKVSAPEWSATPGWSFFDDYDYYEKLQDKADDTNADADKDNVKRQYRNIAGKIFAIGMTGDEFGRLLVKEVSYAVTVIESEAMANTAFRPQINATEAKTDAFAVYCKDELDYDTLSYLLAFHEYLNPSSGSTGSGLAESVRLYGYYYDYEKVVYDVSLADNDKFEKTLKYGHQSTFTTAEWLDYVSIQRNNYVKSYRYSDTFYEGSFYAVHLSFQELKENKENIVYDIRSHNNKTYSGEMRSGMVNSGFAGQLKMTDWLWCYGGDDAKMTGYNDANTRYENSKNKIDAEQKAEGEFYYNVEQLKITSYLLGNMDNNELGGALRYQVYNYSSDMIGSIQGNKKESVLISVGKQLPEDYIYTNRYVASGDLAGAKAYANGKLEAFNKQIEAELNTANVDTKVKNTSSESWFTMKTEVDNALKNEHYTSIASFSGDGGKLEMQENLVIKKKWDCGVDIGQDCPRGDGHAVCVKEYDTTHAISQFADKYASILQHVAGQSVVTFKALPDNTNSNKDINYKIGMTSEDLNAWHEPMYKAANTGKKVLTKAMLPDQNSYSVEKYTITMESGLGFVEGIEDAGEATWWEKDSKPARASSNVSEKPDGSNTALNFTYTYTFEGWYLDSELKYKLENTDIVNFSLTLYAGYSVIKVQK